MTNQNNVFMRKLDLSSSYAILLCRNSSVVVIMKDDRKIKGSVVRGSVSTSALYCVVRSLDKKLYSTSFLFTQVYKWVWVNC